MSWRSIASGTVAIFIAASGIASAQTGIIAGSVRDTTGAVLPGVTVEAASPALIEKVRAAATDEQGQYKIVDLRPGTYTVTFGLTGFNTVKREGIEVSAGFTANLGVEMRVGAMEETITVSGQQSARRRPEHPPADGDDARRHRCAADLQDRRRTSPSWCRA